MFILSFYHFYVYVYILFILWNESTHRASHRRQVISAVVRTLYIRYINYYVLCVWRERQGNWTMGFLLNCLMRNGGPRARVRIWCTLFGLFLFFRRDYYARHHHQPHQDPGHLISHWGGAEWRVNGKSSGAASNRARIKSGLVVTSHRRPCEMSTAFAYIYERTSERTTVFLFATAIRDASAFVNAVL